MILSCRTLTETRTADGVGSIDSRVNGEARGGDVASGLEVASGGFGELRGLPRIGADLLG